MTETKLNYLHIDDERYTQAMSKALKLADELLPHYARPDTWLTAVRVLLSFLTPLLISSTLSLFIEGAHTKDLFGAALSAGMLALADPRGSTERRSITILGAVSGGLFFYFFGQLASGHVIRTVILCSSIGFFAGYLGNFGMAGVRAGFFWMSMAFMSSTASATTRLIHFPDILSGGALCLVMALAFFRTPSWQRKTLKTRLKDARINFLNDLRMKTTVGRMAYRSMIATGLSVIIVYLLGLSRAEWAAACCISLYFPKSAVIYKRGLRLLISSFLAVVTCFFYISYLHNFYITALLVGFLLFMATSLRETDYAGFVLANTMFFVLVIMLGSEVGGVDLLRIRLTNVALGVCVGLMVAALSLPARERLAILVHFRLPLPKDERIDDPHLSHLHGEVLFEKLIQLSHNSIEQVHEHLEHVSHRWLEGHDIERRTPLQSKKLKENQDLVLQELKEEIEREELELSKELEQTQKPSFQENATEQEHRHKGC